MLCFSPTNNPFPLSQSWTDKWTNTEFTVFFPLLLVNKCQLVFLVLSDAFLSPSAMHYLPDQHFENKFLEINFIFMISKD